MAARGAAERVAIRESIGVKRDASQSFGAPRVAQGPRLTPAERADLEELWGVASAALGVRSVQGAVEDRLRRSPPRDEVRNEIVSELERAGGRAPEGRVLRILVVERGWSTDYEARRAVKLLVAHGRVERMRVEMPPGATTKKDERSQLTLAQSEWTGFDLRLIGRDRGELSMRLALKSTQTPEETRRARWREQDAALEREWHIIECGDGETHTPFDAEPDRSADQRTKLERATRSLAGVSALQARVLRALFVDRRQGETETEAVARGVHVSAAMATALIVETFEAYRAARKRVIACRVT